MSIRLKIVLILGLLLLSISAFNFIFAVRFIIPSFEKVEEKSVKTNVERVLEAYNNEFVYLGSKLADWANWNDTYEFIVDRNDAYIESNLTDVSVQNLGIDMMIFINAEKEVVYEKGFDMESEQPITDFSGWSDYIKTGDILCDNEENSFKKGLLMIKGQPVLFASRPILTSDAAGPNRGTIIFAKFFDESEINKIASLTKSQAKFYNVEGSFPHEHDKEISDSLMQSQSEDKIFIANSDDDNIIGHVLIRDYSENPRLFLEVKIERVIYKQGVSAVKYFMMVSAVGGLVLLILTSLMLDKMVIKKIINFNVDVSKITGKNDFTQRIKVAGKDEFSNMSANTNIMLEALERASFKTESEHQRAQSYLKVMETMLIVLNLDGEVNFINKKALEVLGMTSEEEVVGKNWFANFIPKKEVENVKMVHSDIIKGKNRNPFFENLVLTKKGEDRLILWHNAALNDGAGNIIGTVSSGDDITERKSQENKEKEQVTESRRLSELLIGRELKMVELKKEIVDLKDKLNSK